MNLFRISLVNVINMKHELADFCFPHWDILRIILDNIVLFLLHLIHLRHMAFCVFALSGK